MCSIEGIIHFGSASRDELVNKISVMQNITRHRGPDQSNILVLNQAALGTNRLAIIAPDENSTIQSMEQDGIHALFNGEIVNHRELRGLLRDMPIDRQCDSVLILPLFKEYGEDFAKRLAGMFAIAIYDQTNNRLQLWRDPLGVKPLYYHRSKNSVLFSSEVKAVYAAMDNPPEVDFAAVDHILRYRFHPGRSTVFPDIKRVLPGETVTFEEDRLSCRRYWGLTPNQTEADPNFQIEQFRVLLTDVVKEHTQADVRGGFFVSGGLDSSLITAVALQTPSPYETPISIRFSPKSVVDEKYAKVLEDFLGKQFEWVTISDSDARQTLREIVAYIDEPLENPIHIGTYLMAKRAKELGIKSVLTGDGSDEFFLGYERIACWLNGSSGDPNATYLRLLSTMKPDEAAKLYREEATALIQPIIDSFDHPIEPLQNIDQVLLFERLDHLSEYHNMRIDRMTMAHGVEARVPFEDHRLVEFALHVPIATLFGTSAKEWLGEAAKLWLPNEIINRPKVHFPSLPDQWLKGNGAEWTAEVLLDHGAYTRTWVKQNALEEYINEHKNKESSHGRLLWALMVLELWFQNLPSWKKAQVCA